jgi:hypothetical protein
VRRSLKRAFAVTALLALSSPSAIGWLLTFHLATGDHNDGHPSDHTGVVGLEMAMHGHAHDEATPAHGHAFVTGVVGAPMPGRLLLMVGSMIGDAQEVVGAEISDRRVFSEAGATHDPPRIETVTILRI